MRRPSEMDERMRKLSETMEAVIVENRSLKMEIDELKSYIRARFDPRESTVRQHLVDEVSSIIGLREAITSKCVAIRLVWATLLTMGVFATVYEMYEISCEYLEHPTATSVKFEKRPTYDFPPLVLCSAHWLDVDRAVSMGISVDALTYALGYMDDLSDGRSVGGIFNTSEARREFIEFYESRRFESLIDFYRSVAIHPIVPKFNEISNGNVSGSFYYCSNCEGDFTLEYVDSMMCYVSRLKPVYPPTTGASYSRMIAMGLEDRSRGMLGSSPTHWYVLVCNSFETARAQCRYEWLRSGDYSMVEITVTEHQALNRPPEAPCLENVDPNYSAMSCWSACRNEMLRAEVGCVLFWHSDGNQDPRRFCNFFDTLPNNMTVGQLTADMEARVFILAEDSRSGGSECFHKCGYPCNRTMHNVFLELQYALTDSDRWDLGDLIRRRPDMSVVLVEVSNAAAVDGGIAVWTEVRTFSLSQFVSSVGGALGLFVGATVLSFAQIVIFGVNYVIEWYGGEGRRRKISIS